MSKDENIVDEKWLLKNSLGAPLSTWAIVGRFDGSELEWYRPVLMVTAAFDKFWINPDTGVPIEDDFTHFIPMNTLTEINEFLTSQEI